MKIHDTEIYFHILQIVNKIVVPCERLELSLLKEQVSKTCVSTIPPTGHMVPKGRIELPSASYQLVALPLSYMGINYGVSYRTRTCFCGFSNHRNHPTCSRDV